MKTLSAANQTTLASGQLPLALCYKFTRQDGVEINVTGHVETIQEGGDTYIPGSGFSRTNTSQNLGLAVDNHDVAGFFDVDAVSEADLAAGLYDNAVVDVFYVNYETPADGRIWVGVGRLGQVKLTDGAFSIEFRSILQLFDTPVGKFYGPYCRHRLGSPTIDPLTGEFGCGVDLVPFTVTGTVTSVPNNRRTLVDIGRTEADDWFTGGVLTWTSGPNNGLSFMVKANTNATRQIHLLESTPFDIVFGHTYSVHAGCNHLFRTATDPDEGPYTGDCIVKFSNGPRFGGEPESLAAALKFGGSANT